MEKQSFPASAADARTASPGGPPAGTSDSSESPLKIIGIPYVLSIAGPHPPPQKQWKLRLFANLRKPMEKQLFSASAADARTASPGRPPAGDLGFFGKPIETHWDSLCFLQPRPAGAPSGPGPLRRNLGEMMVIRKPWKTIGESTFPASAAPA